MSRLGRRRSLTVAGVALATLVAPAAAHAATYTVKAGDGPCGGADIACGGLVEAAAAAAPGDVFNVAAGTYPAATFAVGGVTINGVAGVAITGTMEFAGAAGGVSTLSKVAINQGTAAAPGVLVSGNAGLVLSDAVVVSNDGHGVLLTAGTANKIVRSAIATGGAETSAIRIENGPGTNPQEATVESSIVVGGAAGIGIKTTCNLLEAACGDVSVDARHVTAAGSTHGLLLDSSQALRLLSPGTGNITVELADSIALNNQASNYPGVVGTGLGANSATINAVRSVQSGDPQALFADAAKGNYRLRPGSPAIGQGGVTAGESTTDIDGEDRASAPTDLGADEFNNAPPVARVVVATKVPRSGQPVTLDGSGSSDREATYGGGIVEYRWRFSDGGTATTTTPTVQHTFATEGDAGAALIVVDRQGAASAEATVALKVGDGVPPAVGILKPTAKQRIALFTRKTTTVKRNGVKRKVTRRIRTRIQIAGLSKDKSGVAQVILTIEKITSRTTKSRCYWYDAKKGVRQRSCKKPVLLYAKLGKGSAAGTWTYNISTSRPLAAGSYRVSAYGIDTAGVFGNSADAKIRTIRFTVR